MVKTGSFQMNKFDPILLSSQIIGFQAFLYLTLSLILLVGLNFLDINLSLSAIFDFRVSLLIVCGFWECSNDWLCGHFSK